MAKKNKSPRNEPSQPAPEADQVAEVSSDDSEAAVPEASGEMMVVPESVVLDGVPLPAGSTVLVKDPVFNDVTPERPKQGKMSLREAVVRYLNDPRYKDSWNPAILKHAHAHGHKSECTAEEWLHVFRTYGLKVRE